MEENSHIKLQRTGFTEMNLLFINHLGEISDEKLSKLKSLDINRMYSKAGFYDKKISGTYFDIDVESAEKSENFNRWINEYEISLKDSLYLNVLSHIKKLPEFEYLRPALSKYVDTFNHCNESNKHLHNYWTNPHKIYNLLDNKKILILNSFATLIESQYSSGNVHKIYQDFPNFNDLICIDFPYTFFNNGPHENFFETLDFYMQIIKSKDFDIALISCGPYGSIITNRIYRELNKSAFTMGSGITPMFGIQPRKCEPNWICKIPEKYIPEGFEKIEKGRYWIGLDKKL